MVARRAKKYEKGEASHYMTRKQALHKLQLTLKDFRRLCILKGIHPREPRNRKRAQKGDLSRIKTLFYEKDIRFLLHEPIVDKFRDFKVFLKKIKKASDKRNLETVKRLKANKPIYSLDHIVKERYPSFVDAVRDLEDCLCLCFLFATFASSAKTPCQSVHLCRRLTVEFMHYVIEARALRKVFVSIKGIYYQAEVLGQTVTWIVPHPFAYDPPANVDFRLMSIFTEFYTTVLGFVNFRLYHNLNLKYPPSIQGISSQDETLPEYIAALNQSLIRNIHNEEESTPVLDEISMGNDGQMSEAKKRADEIENLKTLFKGLKMYINREVPRESVAFMLRCFGAEVSWDPIFPGSTFKEDDLSITHQICDRNKESMTDLKVGRDYVQPQWIFDSINHKQLLPTHKYFLGEVLPPHLSPFIEERRIGDYVPPEESSLFQEEKESEDEKMEEGSDIEEEDSEAEEEDEVSDEKEDDNKLKSMKVAVGKSEIEDEAVTKKKMEDEEYRLRVMMIKKKHKGLYNSMMKSRKKRQKEANFLSKKRKEYDANNLTKQ